VIIKTFEERDLSPMQIPAVLVHSTARLPGVKMPPMPYITRWCWKSAPIWACSRASWPAAAGMQSELLDKHYLRKHGANAYYGQNHPELICSLQYRRFQTAGLTRVFRKYLPK
jgi:L-ribulose-5-phosphate 4-epimerase